MANRTLNILSTIEGQPKVMPKDFQKVIGDPSSIIDLSEKVPRKKVNEPSFATNFEGLPRKEVGILSKTSTNAQVAKEIIDSEAGRTIARRFVAIAKNTSFLLRLSINFEFGFNRCIKKAKEF